MSANVLDLAINETVVPEGIWWENGKKGGKDGTSRIALAKRILGDETADEICNLMDWTWNPDLARLVNPKTGNETDAWEITRSDNKQSLGIIKASRKVDVPPSPRELVEWLDKARLYLSAKWGTLGMTDTTAKLWAQIALDNKVDLGDGDIVENRLLLGYDYPNRSGKVKCCITNAVCENTFIMATSEKANGRVDYDFSSMDDAAIQRLEKKMGIVKNNFDTTVHKYQYLQGHKVGLETGKEIETFAYIMDTDGLLEKIMRASDQEQMVQDLLKANDRRRTMEMGRTGKDVLVSIVAGLGQDLEARKDNWYGAVQGVTYYYDHVAGRNEDSRVDSAYFGKNSQIKEQALECAMLMANVTA